jgi:hypothetical protein
MTPNLAARFAGRFHAAWIAALAVALHLVLAGLARADDLGDFQAAVASAQAQYHIAMTTLATRGQAETAREVQRLRQSWQALAEGFRTIRSAENPGDQELAQSFVQVDVRLVGVLLVIEMGSREAARDALAPIEDALHALQARITP